MISRLRKYQCPNCHAYRVLPTKNKLYRCNKCCSTFKSTQLDLKVWEDIDGDLTCDRDVGMDEATARFILTVMYMDTIGQELAPEANESARRQIAIDYVNSVMND